MAIAFKSIDEQIKILEQRGLKIDDKPKAKKLLLRSNYYDVVNGYSSFINAIKNRVKNLERCLRTGDAKEILSSIGFPNNWYELLTETQEK
jgi:hypothetical protein